MNIPFPAVAKFAISPPDWLHFQIFQLNVNLLELLTICPCLNLIPNMCLTITPFLAVLKPFLNHRNVICTYHSTKTQYSHQLMFSIFYPFCILQLILLCPWLGPLCGCHCWLWQGPHECCHLMHCLESNLHWSSPPLSLTWGLAAAGLSLKVAFNWWFAHFWKPNFWESADVTLRQSCESLSFSLCDSIIAQFLINTHCFSETMEFSGMVHETELWTDPMGCMWVPPLFLPQPLEGITGKRAMFPSGAHSPSIILHNLDLFSITPVLTFPLGHNIPWLFSTPTSSVEEEHLDSCTLFYAP